MKNPISLIMVLLLLGACSSADDPPPTPNTESAGDHVFSGQQRAMEKAKGVEQTLSEAAAQQQREIDQQLDAN